MARGNWESRWKEKTDIGLREMLDEALRANRLGSGNLDRQVALSLSETIMADNFVEGGVSLKSHSRIETANFARGWEALFGLFEDLRLKPSLCDVSLSRHADVVVQRYNFKLYPDLPFELVASEKFRYGAARFLMVCGEGSSESYKKAENFFVKTLRCKYDDVDNHLFSWLEGCDGKRPKVEVRLTSERRARAIADMTFRQAFNLYGKHALSVSIVEAITEGEDRTLFSPVMRIELDQRKVSNYQRDFEAVWRDADDFTATAKRYIKVSGGLGSGRAFEAFAKVRRNSGAARILFLTGNPERILQDYWEASNVVDSPLEYTLIDEAIKSAENDLSLSRMTVEDNKLPLSDNLRDAIQQDPTILHWSDHGNVVNGGPGDKEARVKELEKIFREASKGGIECAVLNLCNSSVLAQKLFEAGIVSYVIGVEGVIFDTEAIEFSKQFYGSLARGETVLHAFRKAAAEVRDGVIQIFHESISPAEIPFVRSV